MSDNLPKNRKQLFKYLASRWDAVLSVSLLVTLLAVPLIAVIMVQSAVCANITLQMNQAPDNEKAVYVLRLLRAQSVGALVSVVGFYPLCLGLNGAFRYYKRTVWAEGATIRDDFWQGVKDGLVQSIGVSILSALTYLFFVSAKWFVQAYIKTTWLAVVAYILVAAVIVFACSIVMYDIAQHQIYKVGAMQRLKNSLIFALVKFPMNIVFVAAALLPFVVLTFLPEVMGLGVAFVAYAVYCFGLSALLQTLYCHSVFDKYINKEAYPQLVGKGLVKDN